MTDLKQLFDDLVRFETELWDAVDSRLRREFGVGAGSFDTMQVIDRTDECRVYEIARSLAITVGGASKVVDRIEAAGHCRRRDNPHDRRSSIVELTPAGTRLLSAATVAFEDELHARLAAPLSARALGQLGIIMARLRSAGVEGTATG